MKNAGSVHTVSTNFYAGVVQITLSTDSATTKGLQTQRLGGATERSRLIGTSLYIYGDRATYAQDFGVKNTKLANEWVFVPSTNKNYVNISFGILLPSLLHEMLGVSGLKVVGHYKINGQEAVAIKGSIRSAPGASAGTQTLYVSTRAPYRPIALTDAGLVSGRKVSGEVVFSKWGEPVVVTKPGKTVTATASNFP